MYSNSMYITYIAYNVHCTMCSALKVTRTYEHEHTTAQCANNNNNNNYRQTYINK